MLTVVFPQFPRPLLLQPTIWTSERGADLGSGRCQPRPHLPIYRMTPFSWPKWRLRLYSAWIDSCGYVVIPFSYLKRILKN